MFEIVLHQWGRFENLFTKSLDLQLQKHQGAASAACRP
jgi:hypothetical protein